VTLVGRSVLLSEYKASEKDQTAAKNWDCWVSPPPIVPRDGELQVPRRLTIDGNPAHIAAGARYEPGLKGRRWIGL
jgi:hypothetical protein